MTAYAPAVLEHFRRPRNRGTLAHAPLSREGVDPSCGDRVRVQARVRDGRLSELAFAGDACAIAVAAASLLTGLARGRTLADCEAVPDDELLGALGDLPAGRRRCALLALDALRAGAAALRASYTVALLLAAGRGTRFGGGKLVASLDGAPIVRHAAARVLAGRPAELLVVVAPGDDAVPGALDGLPLRIVRAPARDGGLSASLRAGLTALPAAARRVLVALGDQPGLDPAVVERVMAAPHAPIVLPRYRGVRGHPVRFDRALLPELDRVEGDRGAREVIARDPARVHELDVDAPPPGDVDTPAALDAMRAAGIAPAAR